MQADIELVRKITCGALRVAEENGAIVFHRFSEEQRKVYESNHGFWLKTFADSGIRLEFATDAAKFAMRGRVAEASSRAFCFFDVCVNDALVKHVGTHSIADEPEFGFEVELPEGTNRVAVYLPGLSKVMLGSLEFTGAEKVEPVAKKRRILCYGDSITQGYDARYPSLAYTNIVADMLDAEVVNKAIGGDRFNPELAEFPDAGRFDLVIVGYGTNDWSHESRSFLEDRSARFFDALERNYPGVPVCAILPLWRHDHMRVTEVGTFGEGHAIIRAAAEKHKLVTVVDGWELLPHLESCVSDGLHPNDFGFQFMARNLLKRLPVV
jgi:lysophospholipase L1-like esterase